jgi:hypothetical protein
MRKDQAAMKDQVDGMNTKIDVQSAEMNALKEKFDQKPQALKEERSHEKSYSSRDMTTTEDKIRSSLKSSIGSSFSKPYESKSSNYKSSYEPGTYKSTYGEPGSYRSSYRESQKSSKGEDTPTKDPSDKNE